MTGRHERARRIGVAAIVAATFSVAIAGVDGGLQAQAQQKPAKKDPIAKAAEAWPDAQQLADRRVAADSLPLFKSQEPLAFTLTSDFGAINRDRNPNSTKRFPGTLQVPGDGGVQPIPVQVGARGHARRDPRVCSVVPIRLDFAKQDLAGTLFEGQRELKLVTHCENNSDGEQHVLTEYRSTRFSTCSRRGRSGLAWSRSPTSIRRETRRRCRATGSSSRTTRTWPGGSRVGCTRSPTGSSTSWSRSRSFC